jgi:hypothetical protein
MNVPRETSPVAGRHAVTTLRPHLLAHRRFSWAPDVHRDAMLVIGLVVGLACAIGGVFNPVDAVVYWDAGSSTKLYPESWNEIVRGYLFYPPPVAQASTLLQPLGWPLFSIALMVGTFAAFWYCAREWSLPLLVIGIPHLVGLTTGPASEVGGTFLGYALLGNLQWILAALTVVALRHPSIWSVLLVTKVTTAIGWWWHVLRGEWRAAAVGALATLAVVVVSVALAPALWADYLGFAARNFTAADAPMQTFAVPLWARLATGIPLLVWGARTDRPWVLPVVCGWSLVGLYGFGFLPFWVAAWRVR